MHSYSIATDTNPYLRMSTVTEAPYNDTMSQQTNYKNTIRGQVPQVGGTSMEAAAAAAATATTYARNTTTPTPNMFPINNNGYPTYNDTASSVQNSLTNGKYTTPSIGGYANSAAMLPTSSYFSQNSNTATATTTQNLNGYGGYHGNNERDRSYRNNTNNIGYSNINIMTTGGNNDRMGGQGKNQHSIRWNDFKQPTFVKDFYQEHPDIAKLTNEEVEKFRNQYNMTVSGKDVPKPVRTFKEACFPDYLQEEVQKAGFLEPTPIQCQGWPMALGGRDVIGISATGSGKTLAFVQPAIVHINAQPLQEPGDGPIVQILSPTRELAMQTMQQCEKFGYTSRIKYSCCYGGVPKSTQARELRAGVEIQIATPGRLIDFLESSTTNQRRVTYLVLDEADRMLDMGFEQQIRSILSQVRPDRQTQLWSATWPTEIQRLAHDYTNDPIQVTIGSLDLKANQDITQIIRVVEEYNKRRETLNIQRTIMQQNAKVLIFTSTKRTADDQQRFFRNENITCRALHGDKSQDERDFVLAEFRSGRIPIMIATDVASRGIDVKDIKVVINFDFPSNLEDYVHRVGRTGRAGAKGTAVSFLTIADSRKAKGQIEILKQTNQQIPPEQYQLMGLGSNTTASAVNNVATTNPNVYRGVYRR